MSYNSMEYVCSIAIVLSNCFRISEVNVVLLSSVGTFLVNGEVPIFDAGVPTHRISAANLLILL